MVTKNTTYTELRQLITIGVSLSEEAIPLKSQLNLTRIIKGWEPTYLSIQPTLDKHKEGKEGDAEALAEAWNSPIEVSFEPFDFEPIKDFIPETSKGKGYGFLLDFITA